jgi:hypothetical protein
MKFAFLTFSTLFLSTSVVLLGDNILFRLVYLFALAFFASSAMRVFGDDVLEIFLFSYSTLIQFLFSPNCPLENSLCLFAFGLFLRVKNQLAIACLTAGCFYYPRLIFLLVGYFGLIIYKKPAASLSLMKSVIVSSVLYIFSHLIFSLIFDSNLAKFSFYYQNLFQMPAGDLSWTGCLYSGRVVLSASLILGLGAFLARFQPFRFSIPAIFYLFAFKSSPSDYSLIYPIIPILVLLSSSALSYLFRYFFIYL